MAKKIAQVRYYSDADSSKNQPGGSGMQLRERLRSGSVFNDKTPMIQLGIQSLPGTRFYLNDSVDPVIIGSTGIYELELDKNTEIFALSFSKESLELINDNPNAFLLVDIIYEGEV